MVRGWPATVENSRPKSLTNSHHVVGDNFRRARMGGATVGDGESQQIDPHRPRKSLQFVFDPRFTVVVVVTRQRIAPQQSRGVEARDRRLVDFGRTVAFAPASRPVVGDDLDPQRLASVVVPLGEPKWFVELAC